MRDFLTANYHTHTVRCRHAYDPEREYIETAIKMGIKKLGFSDHIPCPFTDGYVSGIRMTMEQAPEYVSTIRTLAEEYKDDIKIFVGFEAEYIPLKIEAIPVSRDSVVLLVTKVEDPEELDTRFSRFAPHLKDEMDEILGLSTIGLSERADEILDMFQKKVAEAEAAQEEDETASQISEGPAKAPAKTGQNRKKTEELIRLFCFGNLDHVIDASHVLDTFFTGPSSLYKDPAEQTYYLRIKRGSTPLEDFYKSCNILSEYGTCIRQPYQTDEYLDEHFSCMIDTDAIRKLAQV